MLIRLLDLLLKAPARLRHLVAARMLKRQCVAAEGTRFAAEAIVSNPFGEKEHIRLGKHCLVHGNLALLVPGATISMGDYCFVSQGTRIWASAGIRIGHRVLISHNVNILDTNSHSISADQRHREYLQNIGQGGGATVIATVHHARVSIEDDVWLGFNASVLKGVTVGRGAIVAANSVVTKDVAPYSIVAGNPPSSSARRLHDRVVADAVRRVMRQSHPMKVACLPPRDGVAGDGLAGTRISLKASKRLSPCRA